MAMSFSAGPRRFNEAEARAPRMPGKTISLINFCASASMRPRRARLGCNFTVIQHSLKILASMRPRRARLGCHFHRGPTSTITALQ